MFGILNKFFGQQEHKNIDSYDADIRTLYGRTMFDTHTVIDKSELSKLESKYREHKNIVDRFDQNNPELAELFNYTHTPQATNTNVTININLNDNFIKNFLYGIIESFIQKGETLIPVAKSEFDKLPEIPFNELHKHTTLEISDFCAICTDVIQGEEKSPVNVKFLPCQHYFHINCIGPWLLNYHNKCPTCRATVLPENALTIKS